MKRRRTKINSENLSTTGTNETETNTVEIFQPIPSNLFLPTYKKYDDEDIKRPFVSSHPSVNLSHNENLNNISTYATIKVIISINSLFLISNICFRRIVLLHMIIFGYMIIIQQILQHIEVLIMVLILQQICIHVLELNLSN